MKTWNEKEEQKKLPPTITQLERIEQLLEEPGVVTYLYPMVENGKFDNLIQTQGGAGVLISMIRAYLAKQAVITSAVKQRHGH